MFGFRRKWIYSQEEIGEQQRQIIELMDMRSKSNVREQAQITDSIAISQEVLAFMLDENVMNKRGKRKHAV